MEHLMNGYVSPASSSPPSPLPISVGPGNKNYSFLPSPASSPPTSGHASAENLPLLSTPEQVKSAFSLDRKASDELEDQSSCLKDLNPFVEQRVIVSMEVVFGCKYTVILKRRSVDFYISDFQSGLRALVKTGNGASVTPYVDDSIVIDVNPANETLSPEFIRWLGERNLSSDDRLMRLKEGYIKEGSTVSVMGVVQRNDNVLMIVPPPEPITAGCQWAKCIFPASLEGIVLRCEDTSNNDAIPV
ncbi:hypothetical protein V6N13_011053 [Hibiscus sabdariffa]|uniref:Ubiquitin-specific protease family C19-related protein n=1 Tax=Hibiscus sabdariffa TaxID=183260 RepID=A0ABR2SB95_9ROSI